MAQLGLTHNLVGYQYVLNTRVCKHRRFADLLAADTDGTQRHLTQGNLRAFVAFGMRTQAHRAATQRCGHAREIALEGIKIKYQCRCIDCIQMIAGLGSFPGAHICTFFVGNFGLAVNRSSRLKT